MASNPKNNAKRTVLSEKQQALNDEYKRQVKRIKQFIKRAGDRGYLFLDQIPTQKKNRMTGEVEAVVKEGLQFWQLPAVPKKITEASIRKLKAINADYLYKRAIYTDPEFDKIVIGTEGRKIERKRSAQKSADTRKKNKAKTYTNGVAIDDQPTDQSIEGEEFDSDAYYRQLEKENRHRFRTEYQEPPSGNVFDHIFDDVRDMLISIMPSDDRYTKAGKLWPVDEKRLSWSNALVILFLNIQDEVAGEGNLYEYSVYLSLNKEKLSKMVDDAKADSRDESLKANCMAIARLLNRGEPIGDFTEDTINKYIQGEIDAF